MVFDSSFAPPIRVKHAARLTLAAIAIAALLAGSLSAMSGFTTVVSVSSAGIQGNGNSGTGNITPDGRYVAFFSTSTTLAPEDTDSFFDVFVRDLLLGTTSLVSVSSNGTKGFGSSSWPFITDDGFVAFSSFSRNLVAGDTNESWDVFLRDLQTGTTERVSLGINGEQGNHDSQRPHLSPDARFVSFDSLASNLVAGDTNQQADAFVRDRLAGTTHRVSVSSAGDQGNASSTATSVSADGQRIVFHSGATTLVQSDVNGTRMDVFLHDFGGLSAR